MQLTDLADDQFGNLFDSGACSPPPTTLAPGDTYTCLFTEQINGAPGDEHVNTVQAIAEDTVNGIPVFAADDAIVGIEDPASAAIGNLVWMDSNGNGAVDEGKFGLNNVTLRLLFDADGNGDYETVVETTSTIANGEYAFVNLVAGKYRVEVTDNNQILKDKYLTNPPEPLDVTLAPGQVFLDADFGYADIPRPRIGRCHGNGCLGQLPVYRARGRPLPGTRDRYRRGVGGQGPHRRHRTPGREFGYR